MLEALTDDDQREEILAAALACYTELGEERMSLDAVAGQAGLTVEVVQRCFPTIADLRAALFDLWSERLSAWLVYA